jgi:hypothetical protein
MWQCLPVPVFGHHNSLNVRVATVGLNPSATEFLNDERDWKSATERLPLVIDFGVRERERVSAADLIQAANLRATYFERTPHAWFMKIQELLSRVNPEWNYLAGTAVHIDLVACGTWLAWGNLSQEATGALIINCHKHLKRTLTELPENTLLLLDGSRVHTTLAAYFRIDESVETEIGNVTAWRGSLRIEGNRFNYKGWSRPVNRLLPPNRDDLVCWLRG